MKPIAIIKRTCLAGLPFALLASLASGASGASADTDPNRVPELGNYFVAPANGATALEVDFAGDQTMHITAQITDDILTNPFAALHQWNPALPPANPTTVTYDPVAMITRVVFSGPVALPDAVPADWPGPNQCGTTYHAGINMGWADADHPFPAAIGEHWITPHVIKPGPMLNVSWNGVFKKDGRAGTVAFAAFFFGDRGCNFGGWQMIPYADAGKPVKFTLTNVGEVPVKIGLVGFELGLIPSDDPDCLESPQCPANQAKLDALNGTAMPAPGEPGSPFTPVKPSKKKLQPGESFVFRAR